MGEGRVGEGKGAMPPARGLQSRATTNSPVRRAALSRWARWPGCCCGAARCCAARAGQGTRLAIDEREVLRPLRREYEGGDCGDGEGLLVARVVEYHLVRSRCRAAHHCEARLAHWLPGAAHVLENLHQLPIERGAARGGCWLGGSGPLAGQRWLLRPREGEGASGSLVRPASEEIVQAGGGLANRLGKGHQCGPFVIAKEVAPERHVATHTATGLRSLLRGKLGSGI